MTYAVGDRVRVRADAPLEPGGYWLSRGACSRKRRGRIGTVTAIKGELRVVDFGNGHLAEPHVDDLEPESNVCGWTVSGPVFFTGASPVSLGSTTIQPPTPVAKAPGSAPPESLPGSLDAAECPLCHSAASRPSPIARRVERVVTDPIGAALIAWAIAVGGALWHFR